MTGELVGPVPTIRFHDGTRQAYTPPRDTMDNRYVACTEHRPACDCREAWLAEELAERLAMLAEVEKAAEEILAGHPSYSWRVDPETGDETEAHCMCTGCQIARRAHLFAARRVVRRVQDDCPNHNIDAGGNCHSCGYNTDIALAEAVARGEDVYGDVFEVRPGDDICDDEAGTA